MVDELKQERRKLENLLGCEVKVDVTSKAFTDDLIRALLSKYKADLADTLRLHRLQLLYDLIENAKQKKGKLIEEDEAYVLSKTKKSNKKEEMKDEKVTLKKEPKPKREEDVVAIRAEDMDNWKDLMTLSKVYYALEHPNSKGLNWKRRVAKNKFISKFGDKDLIEWRVGQLFRLQSLEEWAVSRSVERELAEKSPYDFDELLEDNESRELEDIFDILDTQKQEKPKVTKLGKILKQKRPFKFHGENLEDWTESYSDDSEMSGADEIERNALELSEKIDFKVREISETCMELDFDEEAKILQLFSTYKEIKPYTNPIMEELKNTETMDEWYELYSKSVEPSKYQKNSLPKFTYTINEEKDVDAPDAKKSALIFEPVVEKEDERNEIDHKEVHKITSSSELPDIAAIDIGREQKVRKVKAKLLRVPGQKKDNLMNNLGESETEIDAEQKEERYNLLTTINGSKEKTADTEKDDVLSDADTLKTDNFSDVKPIDTEVSKLENDAVTENSFNIDKIVKRDVDKEPMKEQTLSELDTEKVKENLESDKRKVEEVEKNAELFAHKVLSKAKSIQNLPSKDKYLTKKKEDMLEEKLRKGKSNLDNRTNNMKDTQGKTKASTSKTTAGMYRKSVNEIIEKGRLSITDILKSKEAQNK